jgi:hypothetical protein
LRAERHIEWRVVRALRLLRDSKGFVTPAKAGVQEIKVKEIFNTLDSGFRRNDGFVC